MKGLFAVLLAGLAAFPFSLPEHLAGQEGRVLLIVKDAPSLDLELMLTQEVGVMRNLLQGAGLDVAIASPSGEPLVAGEARVEPDLRLDEVDMGDFVGIIMPCMAMEEEPPMSEAESLVWEALGTGKPVAAQTGSVITLARAGVLRDRRFAYLDDLVAEVPEFQGLDHRGQGIVRDGGLITSGVCPYAARELGLEDGTQALTGALINQIWSGS